MKTTKIIWLLALILMLTACSGDLQEAESHFDLQSVEYIYNTQTHEHFFNDDYIINKNESLIPAVKSRSLDPKIEAVKYLVYYQDGQKNFIPDLVNQVGYPLWSEAEAYEYFVYVPFIKQTSSLIEGYLIVKIVDNNYDFYLMKRNKLYAGIFGYSGYDNFNGEISAFLHFDDKLFSTSDDLISGFTGVVDDNEIIIDSRCTILNWCNCVAWHAVFRPDVIEVETRGGCSANCSECVCTYYIHPDCWDDADQNEWGGGFGNTDWDAESNDDPPGGTGPGGYDNGGGQNPPDWWDATPLDEAGFDEIETLNFINMVCDYAETSNSGMTCQELLYIIDPECLNAPDFEECAEASININNNNDEDVVDACRNAMSDFMATYNLTLTLDERNAIQDAVEAAEIDCINQNSFDEIGADALLELLLGEYPELELSSEVTAWLLFPPKPSLIQDVKDFLSQQGNPNLHLDFIAYALWYVSNNNDLTFHDLVDLHNEFNPEFEVEEPALIENGINIESIFVPDFSIEVGPIVGGTQYRHPHNPPHVIAPDMDYGTDGNTDLLSSQSDLNDSNNELIEKMEVLLDYFTNEAYQPIADKYLSKFVASEGGIYEDADLSELIIGTNNMQNSILHIADQINDALKETNGDFDLLDILVFDQNFRPIFSDGQILRGPKILMNDTEQTNIYRQSYTFDEDSGEWSGSFFIEVIDHFGLDDLDLIGFQNNPFLGSGPGFAAWWILQHVRNTRPFITRLRMVVSLTGNINE